MKKTLVILVILGALGAATWYAVTRRAADQGPEVAENRPRYDFEAEGVVIRQMDADGSLRYEVEAQRILQLPDGGDVQASGIVLHRDPKGTPTGGPQRWRLTADEATLPADGNSVQLKGKVRADGVPAGSRQRLQFAAEELRYDLAAEQASSPGKVELTFGRNRVTGSGLRVDVATGVVALESEIHGTFSR